MKLLVTDPPGHVHQKKRRAICVASSEAKVSNRRRRDGGALDGHRPCAWDHRLKSGLPVPPLYTEASAIEAPARPACIPRPAGPLSYPRLLWTAGIVSEPGGSKNRRRTGPSPPVSPVSAPSGLKQRFDFVGDF